MGVAKTGDKIAPVKKQLLSKGDDLAVSTVDNSVVSKKRTRITVPDKCSICESGAVVDYKDVYKLKRLTSRRGRMIPRTRSGLCSRHQRQVAKAIKYARHMALLPYVGEDQ